MSSNLGGTSSSNTKTIEAQNDKSEEGPDEILERCDRLSKTLDRAFANGHVHKRTVDEALHLTTIAVQFERCYNLEQMKIIIQTAKKFKVLNGDYEGFQEDLEKIRERGGQLELFNAHKVFREVIAKLKSAIATNRANEVITVEAIGLIELLKASLDVPSCFTMDELVTIVEVAKNYEKLDGCQYAGFEKGQQDIKEGRERLEAIVKNLSPPQRLGAQQCETDSRES